MKSPRAGAVRVVEPGFAVTMLHAVWLAADGARDARMAFWAESGSSLASLPKRSRAPGRAHPFAARVPELAEALLRFGLSVDEPIETRVIPLELPTGESGPLPSPHLAGDPDTTAVLHRWRAEAVLFSPARAAEILPLMAQTGMAGNVVAGESLQFWAAAARAVAGLLAREQVVPTILREKRRYAARWRPVLNEWEDAVLLGMLGRAMPASAHCASFRAAQSIPEGGAALREFFDTAVDGLARQAAASIHLKANRFNSSPYDAWLRELGASGERETYSYWTLPTLFHYIDPWVSRALGGGAATEPFRLCLRLEPPEPGLPPETPWRLSFLVQATDDPSLLVDAMTVWRQHSESASFLNRRYPNPSRLLLRELGRAAAIVPQIRAALHDLAPESCDLSATEAYTFIREQAADLRAAGVGVLVPGFVARLGLRLKVGEKRGSGREESLGLLGTDRILSFNWQVALGDQQISREEFEELARLKQPLVQVRGQWVELQPEVVDRALTFFKEHPSDRPLTVTEALRMTLAPDSFTDLPVTGVDVEGWFSDLLERLSQGAENERLEEPAGFVGALRPYQKTGVSWLISLSRYGLGACLADDMGLGKTPSLIAALLHNRATDTNPGPALVVCPTSVVGNWRHELARFAPNLRVLVHHGAGRAREDFAALATSHDVVISSYPLLHRDARELLSVDWCEVVLDEAQNIKNPSTKAAQTARALRARWRAALTGTPVENRLSDLWSIFQFLNPGYLGPQEDFRHRLAGPIERERDPDAARQLKTLVAPFILRRLKTDRDVIADLPEKNEMKVFCTLTKEQGSLYQAVVREAIRQIDEADGLSRRGRILAALTRLKQVCDHPALLLGDGSKLPRRSGKLERLTEMLEEVVAVDDRALIFTQFAEMGELLTQHLTQHFGDTVQFLYGGTPAKDRDQMVRRFQEDAVGPKLFVLSLRAGGTGLNLTRANHVFHFDRWWNPAVENQATDRAFRIGQRRDVQVHKFLCAGTLEEAIDTLIERKVEMAEAIVGANESWLTEMSTDELRQLFTLRREALEV